MLCSQQQMAQPIGRPLLSGLEPVRRGVIGHSQKHWGMKPQARDLKTHNQRETMIWRCSWISLSCAFQILSYCGSQVSWTWHRDFCNLVWKIRNVPWWRAYESLPEASHFYAILQKLHDFKTILGQEGSSLGENAVCAHHLLMAHEKIYQGHIAVSWGIYSMAQKRIVFQGNHFQFLGGVCVCVCGFTRLGSKILVRPESQEHFHVWVGSGSNFLSKQPFGPFFSSCEWCWNFGSGGTLLPPCSTCKIYIGPWPLRLWLYAVCDIVEKKPENVATNKTQRF